jgi:hypothetical protein
MNITDESADPLRDAWVSSPPRSDRELRAIAALVREKDRSLRMQASAYNVSGMTIAVLLATVTGLAAWRANWPLAGVGFAVCAATNLVAVVVLGVAERRSRHRPDPGLTTRAYYASLVELCDRQVRFLRSVKYWYALPLLGGVAIVGVSIWIHTGSLVAAVLIGAVGPLLAWAGIRRMNDVDGVEELQAARREAAAWLADAGGDPAGPGDTDGA